MVETISTMFWSKTSQLSIIIKILNPQFVGCVCTVLCKGWGGYKNATMYQNQGEGGISTSRLHLIHLEIPNVMVRQSHDRPITIYNGNLYYT